MLGLTVWILLAATTVLGAAAVALATGPWRRAGLWTVVLGVAGLLSQLGVDVAALAWLGLGALLVLLAGRTRAAPGAATSAEPPERAAVLRRLACAMPALVLGGVLVGAVLAIDWLGSRPPAAPVTAAAEIGARLLTSDAAILAGCCLLLLAVLAAAAAAVGDQARHRSKES